MEYCPVIFNSKSKFWFNPNSINEDLKVLNLGEIILKKLNEFPSKKVIETNIDTGTQTTASEMKLLVINIALNLQKLGIQKGDIIVFFCSMTSLTTPLIYACLVIGAIYVCLETQYDDDLVNYILNLVDPTLIACDNIHYDRLTKLTDGLKLSNLKQFLSFQFRDDKNSVLQKLCEPQHTNAVIENFQIPKLGNPQELIAALVLTSGTSGKPKLISHSHSSLALGASTFWDINESNVIYVASPLRWISQISAILQPILQNCIRVYATVPPSPQLCAEAIQKYKVTHFFAVATFIKQVLSFVSAGSCNYISSLEAILTGGERIPTIIFKKLKNLNSNCAIIQGYGMTETASTICNSISNPSNKINNTNSGYTLLPGIKCKIINEDGTILMPNQNGLICVRRPVEFGFYWKRNDANESSFTPDRWLITGDYGKIDEYNKMYVYNRYGDLIKSEGKIVIPSLIEGILDGYPLLDASYIVGVPYEDKTKGEFPVAFCKLNETMLQESNLTEDQVKEDIMKFLNLNLPKDQIAPSHLFFQNEFPFTSCGKVDKLSLRSLAIKELFL